MKRFLVAVPVLVGLLSMSAAAQSMATAELHVTVKDPSGRMVTNAKVTARDESRGIERTLENRADGEYHLLSLPPGQYVVTVEAAGFAKATAVGVRVTVGQAAELPVTLNVAGRVTEVTVSGETEIVETQQTSVSTTINQQRIDNLPINGRNYIQFTLTNSQTNRDDTPLLPQAPTSGLNIGGQRARANLVTVDGMDYVDNSVNGIRATVPQDAVQEFQILTNGYAAEYGRAAGGVVNIVSRSGTNALHGTAFGFLRNRDFQAINPFSSLPPGEKPAYTRAQGGISVGGPIKKDKTFFFASYEITRRQETGFSTIGSNNFDLVQLPAPLPPLLVTQTQADCIASILGGVQAQGPCPAANPALVNNYVGAMGSASKVALTGTDLSGKPLFPSGVPIPCSPSSPSCSYVPLQQLIGNYPVSEGTTLVAARLDHKLTPNQQFSLRSNVSPSTVTGIQVQGQQQNFGQNAFSRTGYNQSRDFAITAQHTWAISTDKINEFRFQYARRGVNFNFSQAPGGDQVAMNIAGYAFFGREPFSYVRRVEQRYEWSDSFSLIKGKHNFKFGADINHLPLTADFSVNFGGLFNFGQLPATLLNAGFSGYPSMSPIQAYGFGIPTNFIQGIGQPHDEFSNSPLGFFVQDSWHIKPNLTLNYGVRYDVEFIPEFPGVTSIAAAANQALGITKGMPMDTNNVAPRIGLAWDPWNDGKTVVRASFGIFYDHPLLALVFDSDVADSTRAPQLVLLPGTPSITSCAANPAVLNASTVFQGLLNCPGTNYQAGQQRFDPNPTSNSIFVNQNFLEVGLPLAFLPFGFPTAQNFQYAYSEQVGLSVERDLGHNFALSVAYSFNGGRHLNRPINGNSTRPDLLIQNWQRAVRAGAVPPTTVPILVNVCGTGPLGNFVPTPVVNFFRPSGINPSFIPPAPAPPNTIVDAAYGAGCYNRVQSELTADGLGLGVPVPYSDAPANYSNGSSVYHGMTVNLRKRFSQKYEFLASYTWSHAIDDSVDLESPLAPQDNRNPGAERANSVFDQRHRFVFSGVYQSGRLSGSGFASKFFSNWTVAPIVEISSGRPFNIVTASDRNFDFGSTTDRPLIVAGASTNSCGDVAVQSRFSPTGWLNLPCWVDGTIIGDLKRNAGLKPYTLFNDLRIARQIRFTERLGLDAIVDMFNIINKFNVADVNPLYDKAGQPTASFDPRQFQFGLRLIW
jgi:hypothetical protein